MVTWPATRRGRRPAPDLETDDRLTPVQFEALRVIARFMAKNQISPTVREIAAVLWHVSPWAIDIHLAALEKKGYIARARNKARTIRILRDHAVVRLPRYGTPLFGVKGRKKR